MDITLAVEEQATQQARNSVFSMGNSLTRNAGVRMEQSAGTEQLAGAEHFATELKTLQATALVSPGGLKGWRFDRGEARAHA